MAAFESCGRFGQVELRWFTHGRDQTVAEWLEELGTHSVHLHLDPAVTARLFNELRAALQAAYGGMLHVRYETSVTTGLRI